MAARFPPITSPRESVFDCLVDIMYRAQSVADVFAGCVPEDRYPWKPLHWFVLLWISMPLGYLFALPILYVLPVAYYWDRCRKRQTVPRAAASTGAFTLAYIAAWRVLVMVLQ